jgi:FAD/FMN-containing dehydrogenase
MHIIWKDSADEASYGRARLSRVFNSRQPQNFPLAVVKATCAEDVVAGVKLAMQEQNCQVAVRSGGHSIFVWSLHDNSILIDLGDWKEVVVESNIARVTTSVTGQELNHYLQTHYGLMFPAGHCPDVGLGGFLLQGGQGWNCRVSRFSSLYSSPASLMGSRTGDGPVRDWSLWK